MQRIGGEKLEGKGKEGVVWRADDKINVKVNDDDRQQVCTSNEHLHKYYLEIISLPFLGRCH